MTFQVAFETQSGVRFFLDRADRDAPRRWSAAGLFYGVTTCPTILHRAGLPCIRAAVVAVVSDVLGCSVSEVQAQCQGEETCRLIKTELALVALDPCAAVKVPSTEDGIALFRPFMPLMC